MSEYSIQSSIEKSSKKHDPEFQRQYNLFLDTYADNYARDRELINSKFQAWVSYYEEKNKRELQDSEKAKIFNAAFKHMEDPNDGMYMPTLSHIEKQLRGNSKEEIKSKADIAWNEFKLLQANTSPMNSFICSDPITQGIVNQVGWINISKFTYDEIDSFMWEFKALYQSYKKNPEPLKHLNNKSNGLIAEEKKSALEIQQFNKNMIEGDTKLIGEPKSFNELKNILVKSDDQKAIDRGQIIEKNKDDLNRLKNEAMLKIRSMLRGGNE